jgi:ketosteroid isomerase-like protein
METNRAAFLKSFNKAFAQNDIDFIVDCVTDDIHWTIVGDKVIEGKTSFTDNLREMASYGPMELDIEKIITHGRDAAVYGAMLGQDENGNPSRFSFCDIYTFNGFKNAKISKLVSFVVEQKE